MPQENFTITSQHVTTQFNLAWSEDYADMLLQVQADDDIAHRFLLEASAETLREIADQFYKWADTLEQVNHDRMDKAMAEIKRHNEMTDYLNKRGETDLVEVWDIMKPTLPKPEYEQQFCQCTITGRTEGSTQCSKCGKNLF